MFEAVGMLQKCGFQDKGALLIDGRRCARMHGGRCHIADAGMTVIIVVPGEKCLAERTCICKRIEPFRKIWPVLHGPKLRFRKGDMCSITYPLICCGRRYVTWGAERQYPKEILACRRHIFFGRFWLYPPEKRHQ
jgi:hypothetical protein